MKFNKLFFAGLMLPMAAFVSCSDNMNDRPGMPQLDENGMATISVNVNTSGLLTRGDFNDDTNSGAISSGSKIDVLVYEVYQKASDGTLTPLAYYKTVDDKFLPATEGATSFSSRLNANQSAVSFSNAPEGKTLVFKVDPEANYLIAFWAQSSKCGAYTLSTSTDDKGLQAVTVAYDNYKNNDESRDAFSGTLEFNGSTTEKLTATLFRPFAQINVGTTGADYKASAKIPGGTYYSHSQIKMKGVANTLNIVTDEISGTLSDPITLDWDVIPAWNGNSIPSTDDEKIKTTGEQFLQVHLHAGNTNPHNNADGGFFSYLTDYPTVENATKTLLDETGNPVKDDAGNEVKVIDHSVVTKYLTETFKYLSMSYVLVPSTAKTPEANPTDSKYNKDSGAVLDYITIKFSNANGIGAPNTTPDAATTGLTLYNIPVNRNWRTNILGGLYDVSDQKPGNDPDDPNNPDPDPDDPNNPDPDPDDPTTVFTSVSAKVIIARDYFDKNNIADFSQYLAKDDENAEEGGEENGGAPEEDEEDAIDSPEA